MAVRREDLERGQVAVVYRLPASRTRPARLARCRRRRAALAAAAAVLCAAVGLSVLDRPATRARAKAARATTVVAPGETLWEVAERHAPPDADPRAYVQQLVELNDLGGGVRAGQKLRLPG